MNKFLNKLISTKRAIISKRSANHLLSITQLIIIFILSSFAFCSAINGTNITSAKGQDKQFIILFMIKTLFYQSFH